jgi:outer membrane receptor protein involved in Fe transport
MVAAILALVVVSGAASTAAGADTLRAAADTAATPHVVRRFAEIVVRSTLHDPRSSETVHQLSAEVLRALPVDGLAEALALKAGVVAEGGALHVRGGRTGELQYVLEGTPLNDPQRNTPMEVPLLALRSAELVSGGLDAEHPGALAGVVDLRTVDPGERWEGEWRWQTDGRRGTHYDRASARAGGPLGLLGLGAVMSADVTLDDTYLPSLRSLGRTRFLGGSFGWRADNRLLGHLKLAPVSGSRPVRLELLADRSVEHPFDPMWTLDGWTTDAYGDSGLLGTHYSPTAEPGHQRYRAADHAVMTDDRRLAAVLSAGSLGPRHRLDAALAWLTRRSVTSLDGRDDDSYVRKDRLPEFGVYESPYSEPFFAYVGDEPFFQRRRSDVLTARGDYERTWPAGGSLEAGLGARYDEVALRELDGSSWGTGYDSLRAYHAFAPGGFAYAQGRWVYQGMVLNGGLRADYFTAGPQAAEQSFGAPARDVWALSPRFGVAYPASVRDVFSLSYTRIEQPPPRDFLYENRRLITNRQPLGNPGLEPSTAIAYQAAVKHVFDERWALQAAIFFRDLYGQIGARPFKSTPFATPQPRYENADAGHAEGFELSLLRSDGERGRLELHYTYLHAYGSESLEEGIPYGARRGVRPPPIGQYPLDWDRRHSLALAATWRAPRGVTLAWSTVARSGLPWTPRGVRVPDADLSEVNSRQLGWEETTDLAVRWTPAYRGRHVTLGLDVRNLFDERNPTAVTADGYPNPLINTEYDDYGAYRTATGRGGGAYWNDKDGDGVPGWVPVHDPRLLAPPRAVRMSVGASW